MHRNTLKHFETAEPQKIGRRKVIRPSQNDAEMELRDFLFRTKAETEDVKINETKDM